MLLIVLLGIMEFLFFDLWIVTNLSTYRVFFIPVKLHYAYYEFFLFNDIDYFRQTILRGFFDSPYKESLDFVISDFHLSDPGARANNGLFSDALSNLGYSGVIIFPIFLAFVLRSIDIFSKHLGIQVKYIIAITYSFVFIGLDLSTAFISGGLFLFMILSIFMPAKK